MFLVAISIINTASKPLTCKADNCVEFSSLL